MTGLGRRRLEIAIASLIWQVQYSKVPETPFTPTISISSDAIFFLLGIKRLRSRLRSFKVLPTKRCRGL